MEGFRPHSLQFKHYAFLWSPSFSHRQTGTYLAENTPLLQPHTAIYPTENTPSIPTPAIPLSNEEIVERFVYNKCTREVDRYKCKALQIGRFLKSANIELLKGPPEESLSVPMALIDDRNNASVNRLQRAGNCRPTRRPLNAQELFAELSQAVCPMD
jgi:hypothetical protein